MDNSQTNGRTNKHRQQHLKALNYNEQKLQQGRAEIPYASGFGKDAKQLNFYDKISQFNRGNSLNEKTITNTLHVSFNFDPNERLSTAELTEIANSYVNKIGFIFSISSPRCRTSAHTLCKYEYSNMTAGRYRCTISGKINLNHRGRKLK